MTQQELASQSGLSIPFISQIETGFKKASLETYHKLAEAFQLSLGELFLDPQLQPKKQRAISFKGLSRKQKRYFDHFLKSLA